jgi:hypothetical protein
MNLKGKMMGEPAKVRLSRAIRGHVERLEEKPSEDGMRRICEEISSLVEYDSHFEEFIEVAVFKEINSKFK